MIFISWDSYYVWDDINSKILLPNCNYIEFIYNTKNIKFLKCIVELSDLEIRLQSIKHNYKIYFI